MKTVLVTGAAGFLGIHICEKYLAEGYQIIAVDNFSTGSRTHQKTLESFNSSSSKVIFVEADISLPWSAWLKDIPQDWLQALKYVFHFASPASPSHYLELSLETLAANSIGLKFALDTADLYHARVIFASTSEVYGSQESAQTEDQWGLVNSFGERSCYQEAKRFGESLIYSHNKRFKTRHGLVRIFNTYGPHMNPDDGRVVINFLMQAIQGKALTVFGDGLQTRSLCYVTDLIEAIFRFAAKEIFEPVNIGNPHEMTVLEIAKAVGELFSEKELAIVYKPLPQEEPRRRRPNIEKAKALLDGWSPRVTLPEGLRLMKAWYDGVNQQ